MTIYPALQIAKLDQVLDAVNKAAATAVPDSVFSAWDQTSWRAVFATSPSGDRCGSSMCCAGWAAELDGGQWVITKVDPSLGRVTDGMDLLYATKDEIIGAGAGGWDIRQVWVTQAWPYVYYDEGYMDASAKRTAVKTWTISAKSRATRVLGLTRAEASRLFAGDNSLETIREVVKDIKIGVYRPDAVTRRTTFAVSCDTCGAVGANRQVQHYVGCFGETYSVNSVEPAKRRDGAVINVTDNGVEPFEVTTTHAYQPASINDSF